MFYPYYKNKPKTSVPIGTKEISCGTPFYSTRVIWVLTVLVWSYMIFYIHMLEFKLLMTLTNVSLAKDSYRSVVGLIFSCPWPSWTDLIQANSSQLMPTHVNSTQATRPNLIACKINYTYWKNHSHKPVNRHQYQGVNTDVGCGVDQILNCLTPDLAKRPRIENIICGCRWNTQDNKEQIGHG